MITSQEMQAIPVQQKPTMYGKRVVGLDVEPVLWRRVNFRQIPRVKYAVVLVVVPLIKRVRFT